MSKAKCFKYNLSSMKGLLSHWWALSSSSLKSASSQRKIWIKTALKTDPYSLKRHF